MIGVRLGIAEDPAVLPDGWEEGALAEYIERPEYGFTDSASNDPSGTKFLRITDIQDGQVDWNTVPYCDCPRDVVESKRLLPGDIVVARIGATTGKSFFIDSPPHEAVFASYLIRLRTRETKLLPRFLYFYVQTTAYWAHVDRHKGDRLKGGVNIPVLESLPVVVPPVDEQVRICRVMDCVDAAVRSEAAQEIVATAVKRAVMNELFTRGLRGEAQKETEIGLVPESWNVATIGDVALQTQYGLSLRGSTQGRFPILRMNCQDDGRVVFRDLQYVDIDEATFSAFKLDDGDLLFNRTNSIEHVGRMAIFEGTRESVFASYLVRLTVDARRCLPRFLNYYMNRREVQQDIKRLASRAVGQANINATKLRTIAFPLPASLDEQREIIAILAALDSKIDLHRRKRAVVEEVFNSLLHKLMAGEIRVDQLDLSALTGSRPEATA
ncbi:MAG: restriction endonuclease subunit S [Myxococcaceae bacterium]